MSTSSGDYNDHCVNQAAKGWDGMVSEVKKREEVYTSGTQEGSYFKNKVTILQLAPTTHESSPSFWSTGSCPNCDGRSCALEECFARMG